MAWLIQRTAPGDPIAYWGKHDCWLHRGPITAFKEVLSKKIPEHAAKYMSYEVAFDVAEHLREHQPMAHGEVIAVVSEPESAT